MSHSEARSDRTFIASPCWGNRWSNINNIVIHLMNLIYLYYMTLHTPGRKSTQMAAESWTQQMNIPDDAIALEKSYSIFSLFFQLIDPLIQNINIYWISVIFIIQYLIARRQYILLLIDLFIQYKQQIKNNHCIKII